MIYSKTLVQLTWSREESDSNGSQWLSQYDLQHSLTKCDTKTSQISKKNSFYY